MIEDRRGGDRIGKDEKTKAEKSKRKSGGCREAESAQDAISDEIRIFRSTDPEKKAEERRRKKKCYT